MTDPASPSTSTSGFRADVQGLRAIAVLVVIASHAGLGLSGGYVGVDVFFVVSGFVITGLLLRSSASSGRISLLDFYARRARRLLPAASVVLVATVATALVFAPLVRAVELIRDALWASVFLANYRFASVGTDYFAADEPTSALQHYWSLAVEEQFYLVWPLLLGAWLWLRARRGAGLATLAVGVGMLSAVSLGYGVWLTYNEPVTAYFSTPARAYELGLGCLCAIWVAARPDPLPVRLRTPAVVIGLVGIAVACLLFDAGTAMPGAAALLPTVATALVLLGGATSDGARAAAPSRILGVAPMRVVGDWSYSLYLWHWPILILAQQRWGELSLLRTAGLLVLTFALSATTYHLVENPFRRGRVWRRLPERRGRLLGVALYPTSVALVVSVAVAGNTWTDRQLGITGDNPAVAVSDYPDADFAADPTVALVQASVRAAKEGRAIPSGLEPGVLGLREDTASLGECDYRTGTTRLCADGTPDGDRTIVVLGDSHARAWAPAVRRMGELTDAAVYTLVFSGCSVTAAVQIDVDTRRPVAECEQFKDFARQTVAELEPDLLLVSSSAVSPMAASEAEPVYGMRDQLSQFREVVRDGFEVALTDLATLAERTVVLGNTPNLPREPGACLSTRGADLGSCLFMRGNVAQFIQSDYRRIARGADVEFVNAAPWFCEAGECPAVVGRTITMRDREHMTTDYAEQLAPALVEAIGTF